MKRKIFSVLVCCAMIISIAGCSSKKNTDPTAVTSETVQATGKVYSTGGVKLPLVKPGSVTLTYMGNDDWCPNKSYKDGLPVQNEIEKRTGVKIKYEVVSTDVDTVIETRLAAGVDLPDLVEIPPFDSHIGVQRYASNGVLIPLDGLMKKDAPNILNLYKSTPTLKALSTSADGHIYGIAGWWGSVNEVVPDWITIRADWLKKLNLPMPKTPDELYTVLKAFHDKDPNGDGKQDEVPMIDINLLGTRFLETGFGFPTNGDWANENGKTVYYPVDPRYENLLKYLNKLYSQNLLSHDIQGTQRQQVVSENDAGAYCHDPSDNAIAAYDNLAKAADPNVDYEFIPMIKPTDNSPDPSLEKRDPVWHYYGVTKSCKYPDAAMKWIDYVYASQDGQMLYSYGIQGLSYNLDSNGKPQFTDLITKNKTYSSPFLALRSIGAWPCYFVNDPGDVFMQIFKGTKVEDAGNQYKGKMVDPYPDMLGTQEESDEYSSIWPDLSTYLDESFTNFVTGATPINDSTFNSYVDKAYSMGLDKVIKIKDAQYKRYEKLVS